MWNQHKGFVHEIIEFLSSKFSDFQKCALKFHTTFAQLLGGEEKNKLNKSELEILNNFTTRSNYTLYWDYQWAQPQEINYILYN